MLRVCGWDGFCIVFRFGFAVPFDWYWLWCCLVLGFVLLWFSRKLILVLFWCFLWVCGVYEFVPEVVWVCLRGLASVLCLA